MKARAILAVVFLFLLAALFSTMSGCGGSSNSTSTSFAGTQAPGDFWSWTIDNTAGTFSATNNTKSYNYSGTSTALTGNSAGISKLLVTSTTDPGVSASLSTLAQNAYAVEVPNTVLMVAHAPFYSSGSGVQQSIEPPVFAAAQGSCPSTGANVNWITMPPATWCSKVGDVNPLPGAHACAAADNAYGTAAISVSGGTYGLTINQFKLDGTASGGMNLSGCSCSNGLIQCTDSGGQAVRISFTPSGVFFVDMAANAIAGIVQPSANVDISDFLKAGRSFKAIYHTALDSSQIFSNSASCTSHGGTWVNGVGPCGTHATQPASATTNGTQLAGNPYTDVDHGTLSAQGGTISFATSSQTTPGLVTGTFSDFGGGSSPIVMAVRQVNGKYVALILTHSPNATLGGGFNILAVEQ